MQIKLQLAASLHVVIDYHFSALVFKASEPLLSKTGNFSCSDRFSPEGGADRLQRSGDRRECRRSQLIASSVIPPYKVLIWCLMKSREVDTYPFRCRSPHPAKDKNRQNDCLDSAQTWWCVPV